MTASAGSTISVLRTRTTNARGHQARPRNVDSLRARYALLCMRFKCFALSGTGLPLASTAVPLAFLLGFVGVDRVANAGPAPPTDGLEVSTPRAPDTLSVNRRRRAEHLLADRVACLGCHTLNGIGGAIGPTLDGVGERLRAESIRAKITDPQNITPGSLMPAQPLDQRDVDLLTDLLTDSTEWSGVESMTPAAASQPDLSGSGLYEQHCSSCHGIEGNGDGWNAPNLPVQPTAHADSTLMARRADDTLFDAIHAGGWVLDKSPRMPAFGALLTRDEIRALVAHIRVLCECSGPAWSRDGVGRPDEAVPVVR